MKKMFAILTVLLSVNVAGASYCDQYDFGSQDWWQCISQGGASAKPTNYCDMYQFGSQDWWTCISQGGAAVNQPASACDEFQFGSQDWWQCMSNNGSIQ